MADIGSSATAKTDELLVQNEQLRKQLAELLSVTLGYKEWILAVPSDVASQLPAMPGIDGDWADSVIDDVKQLI